MRGGGERGGWREGRGEVALWFIFRSIIRYLPGVARGGGGLSLHPRTVTNTKRDHSLKIFLTVARQIVNRLHRHLNQLIKH